MRACHNDIECKTSVLRRIKARRAAGRLMRTNFPWEDDAGCAIGCAIYGKEFQEFLDECAIALDNPTVWSWAFQEYESELAIPRELAYAKSAIYYGLPYPACQAWPERFLNAIAPGADLSRVVWKLLHRVLMDGALNPAIGDQAIRTGVDACERLLRPFAQGEESSFGAVQRISHTDVGADDYSYPEWFAERLEKRAERQKAEGGVQSWWSPERALARQVGESASAAIDAAARARWRCGQMGAQVSVAAPGSADEDANYAAWRKLAEARHGLLIALNAAHAVGWAMRGRLEGLAGTELAANGGVYPQSPKSLALRGAWTEDGALRAAGDAWRLIKLNLTTLQDDEASMRERWPRGVAFPARRDDDSEAAYARIANIFIELMEQA